MTRRARHPSSATLLRIAASILWFFCYWSTRFNPPAAGDWGLKIAQAATFASAVFVTLAAIRPKGEAG